MILKLLFPALSNPFKLPEQEEIPLHVAVAFDAFKAKDVFEISDKYPGKVMSIGYFSSDVPGKANEEKIVIQLAKDNAQCFMEFMDLGPSYISTDIEVGAADCFYFFPPGYNTPESEIITYLKKKSKRKGKMGRYKIAVDQIQDTDTQSIITGTEADTSFMDLAGDQIGEDNGDEIEIADDLHNDEGDSGEENEDKDSRLAIQINDSVMDNVDKATSPVAN
ncbi:hypothetical protein HUJ04_002944 [Dendroctonus ponderosae]|nr:hypothetical protein HUJ04_002944 [Dendroctonus ponderosae]KAH1014045.1 hypothetical protein HUJ04_002944 [Dendroctonus ponderosae]